MLTPYYLEFSKNTMFLQERCQPGPLIHSLSAVTLAWAQTVLLGGVLLHYIILKTHLVLQLDIRPQASSGPCTCIVKWPLLKSFYLASYWNRGTHGLWDMCLAGCHRCFSFFTCSNNCREDRKTNILSYYWRIAFGNSNISHSLTTLIHPRLNSEFMCGVVGEVLLAHADEKVMFWLLSVLICNRLQIEVDTAA